MELSSTSSNKKKNLNNPFGGALALTNPSEMDQSRSLEDQNKEKLKKIDHNIQLHSILNMNQDEIYKVNIEMIFYLMDFLSLLLSYFGNSF